MDVDNEPTHVGQDGRTYLARPNLRRKGGRRGMFQLTLSRIGYHTRWMHNLLKVVAIAKVVQNWVTNTDGHSSQCN